MKQILQDLNSGLTQLADVPVPEKMPGTLLIKTQVSLLSSGTERMLVSFGQANILKKACQQPERVKQVLHKVKTDGLIQAIDAVRSKLDQPLPLGYCNVGVVVETDVDGFKKGDRVVSNGYHAEFVRVPKNLCAKIPDGVDAESASFTVLSSIALQGIRLLEPTIGEGIVVLGLGVIGLIGIQILKANGCRVMGVDCNSQRCRIAAELGVDVVDLSRKEDPLAAARIFSRNRGVDGVLICASSKSNNIIHQAAEMSRKRGRIVLVGVTGLDLRREDFFKKEIKFQVSASYGPGRYDPFYEDQGNDYPFGFVRWTQQRNFEAVLDLLATGSLNVGSLITHRFNFKDAINAYECLNNPDALGIALKYDDCQETGGYSSIISILPDINVSEKKVISKNKPKLVLVGAGNYASRVLMPIFKKLDIELDTIISSGGVSSVHHGRKNGFKFAATNLVQAFNSRDVGCVVIATRHNLHAEQVVQSLEANKCVFVEKPLAVSMQQLRAVETAYQKLLNKGSKPFLMIGFNRRFSPHVLKIKELLDAKKESKALIITVNAGAIPMDHWTQDSLVGGGRIIGEACHFIDLARFLIGTSIVETDIKALNKQKDSASITLCFLDGSICTIHYFSNGGNRFPKERIEVFCENAVLQLDNFRVLNGFGWKGFNRLKSWSQDKGHRNCISAFVDAVKNNKNAPIPYEEIIEVSQSVIELAGFL